MQVVLRVVGGKNDGREITISVPRFVIGRGDTAHLRPSSDLVSREHCEIRIGDGQVIVNDLGSRNGSFINGKALTEEHVAKSGELLRVGQLQFELVIDPVKASKKKPKVANAVEAASRTVAKNKKMSLEDSITDWLSDDSDDDETPSRGGISTTDTIQLNLEETSVFGSAKRERKPDEEETADQATNKPGKLPPIPKSTHDSSTSAADDVLRKFFNRR